MAWKPKYPPDPPKRTLQCRDPLIGLAVVLAIMVAIVGGERLMRGGFGSLPSITPAPTRPLPTIVTQPNNSLEPADGRHRREADQRDAARSH